MEKTLTTKSREKVATDAYLKFLQSKGAPSRALYLRSKFLDAFMVKLTGKVQNRKEFANALEETLTESSDEERSIALNTAREYFPFWMNDIKAIAMFEEYYGFNIQETHWKPKHATLKSITDELEISTLTDAESQSLNAYRQALIRRGANKSVLETRSKLVKIILLRLRDAPEISHAIYRISVDLTLPLFKTQEIKKLYLDVVREFYYFWIKDEDAEAKAFS